MSNELHVATEDVYLDADGKATTDHEKGKSLLVKVGSAIPKDKMEEYGLAFPLYVDSNLAEMQTLATVRKDGTMRVADKIYYEHPADVPAAPTTTTDGTVSAVVSEDKSHATIDGATYYFDDVLEQKVEDLEKALTEANKTIEELRKQIVDVTAQVAPPAP